MKLEEMYMEFLEEISKAEKNNDKIESIVKNIQDNGGVLVDMKDIDGEEYFILTTPSKSKMTENEKMRFAAEVITLYTDHLTMANNWGFYLLSEEFEKEINLKNNIFTIWFSSFFDLLYEEKNIVNKYKAIAEDNGYINMATMTDRILEFCEIIKEVVSKYKRAEQVFIQDFRNSLVHSRLNRPHNENIAIKYVEKSQLKNEKLSYNEYHDIIRDLYESGFQNNLSRLREIFTHEKSLYFPALNKLKDPKYKDHLFQCVYLDIGHRY